MNKYQIPTTDPLDASGKLPFWSQLFPGYRISHCSNSNNQGKEKAEKQNEKIWEIFFIKKIKKADYTLKYAIIPLLSTCIILPDWKKACQQVLISFITVIYEKHQPQWKLRLLQNLQKVPPCIVINTLHNTKKTISLRGKLVVITKNYLGNAPFIVELK